MSEKIQHVQWTDRSGKEHDAFTDDLDTAKAIASALRADYRFCSVLPTIVEEECDDPPT